MPGPGRLDKCCPGYLFAPTGSRRARSRRQCRLNRGGDGAILHKALSSRPEGDRSSHRTCRWSLTGPARRTLPAGNAPQACDSCVESALGPLRPRCWRQPRLSRMPEVVTAALHFTSLKKNPPGCRRSSAADASRGRTVLGIYQSFRCASRCQARARPLGRSPPAGGSLRGCPFSEAYSVPPSLSDTSILSVGAIVIMPRSNRVWMSARRRRPLSKALVSGPR